MPMFRPKHPVEALQWKGPTDCEELKTMAGYWMSFGSDGVLHVMTQSGAVHAKIGDWIVKLSMENLIVRTNEQFTVSYEEVSK